MRSFSFLFGTSFFLRELLPCGNFSVVGDDVTFNIMHRRSNGFDVDGHRGLRFFGVM